MKNLNKIIFKEIGEGYYVGGIVRDSLLSRVSADIDIALPKDDLSVKAKSLARAVKANVFEMDAEFGVWRLIVKESGLQIDLTAYQGGNLQADLKRRDFTVNAVCYPISALPAITLKKLNGKTYVSLSKLDKKKIVDPLSGMADIKAKTIRAGSANVFKEDPVRMLRAYRTASELGFKIDKKTELMIAKDKDFISSVAGERVRDELIRLFNNKGAYDWTMRMYRSGILLSLFPLLKDQIGCAPEYYGDEGVITHTLKVVRRMEQFIGSLKKLFPRYYSKLKVYEKDKYIFITAALLHDIAKPATAKVIADRLRFFFHEEKGAKMAKEILTSLRFSSNEIKLICAMIAEHLRPSNLASNDDISDKAVYKFFRDLGESGVPMLLLCLADYGSYVTDRQLAMIMPRMHKPMISVEEGKKEGNYAKTLRHMQLVSFMFKKFFTNKEKILPSKLITGLDVMQTLKIPAGPKVGEILEAVTVAQVEGKVKTRQDALKFIKTIK
ncbi:poly(A) polymerase [Parelusimicrobium proximum]|uniref:HD domain-containing protein n=1 Tax=Parelusimicrobium proximum TaxID=3228953 RepID=UPI003D186FED